MKNEIIEVLMERDGLSRREAEQELRRVQAEFDPTIDRYRYQGRLEKYYNTKLMNH